MPSAKTDIIEALFDSRWNEATRGLGDALVTLEQVSDAIGLYNQQHPDSRLSDRNPANFFKDFIRVRASANRNWPRSVFARDYSAKQRTGEGNCLDFVRTMPGQELPFPEQIPDPAPTEERHLIQSASLPLASRRLGRNDEPWLIQVIVKLRIIETHLSLCSARRIVQVDHLQMSVKLRRAEIDALFLAIEEHQSGVSKELIICCEAKKRGQSILVDQIVTQVKSVFGTPSVTQDTVIPIAVKSIGESEVFVVESTAVDRPTQPILRR